MNLNNIVEILSTQYNCKLLRDISTGGDFDFYSDCLDNKELEEYLVLQGFIKASCNNYYIEYLQYIEGKLISIEISTTLFRDNKFINCNIKNKYLNQYIEDPIKNDIWFRTIKYLLALSSSSKAKEFFQKNKQIIEENNYFLDYLEQSPFYKINIELFIKNKKLFILKCVKNKNKLFTYKIQRILNNIKYKQMIPLIGVDGAGKSTIIANLTKFDLFYSIYFGGRGFYFDNLYNKLLQQNKLFVPFVRFSQYIENLIRYSIGYYKAIINGKIILFDRLPSLEYKITEDKKMRIIYQLLYKYFFPSFKKIIFVYGNEDEIYQRKQELTKEEIIITQDKIKNSGFNLRIVNNENTKIDNSLNEILRIIYA